MVNRWISKELKVAAVRLHERAHLDINSILECCQISWATFFCTLRSYQMTGLVTRRPVNIRFRSVQSNFWRTRTQTGRSDHMVYWTRSRTGLNTFCAFGSCSVHVQTSSLIYLRLNSFTLEMFILLILRLLIGFV